MQKTNAYQIIFILIISLIVLHIFALIPRQAESVCGNLGYDMICMKVAAGFPFIYVIDGQVSPQNSISLDFLNLWIGVDDFIWYGFLLNYIFWILVTSLIWYLIKKLRTM